jgi:polysaccharide biosynthesis protein PelE
MTPPPPPPPKPDPLLWDIIVAAAAALALSVATANAMQYGAWTLYLAFHAIVSAASMAWAWCSGSPMRRQAALLAVSVTFLGAIGAAGACVCALAEGIFRPYARGFMAWYDDLFPEEDEETAELLLNRLRAGGDPASGAADLTSFTDAVTYGSIEQKQAIIALIARRFTPAFAPALRQALEDPTPAVRVQAAAAAAAIEARFATRGMALERKAAAQGYPLEILRELGRLNADMAKCGLMEAARNDASRAKALDYYRRALSYAPKDASLLAACGELLLDSGDAATATGQLTEALRYAQDSAKIASLLTEALMQQGRFAELRAFAAKGHGRFAGPSADRDRLDQSLALWAKGVAA